MVYVYRLKGLDEEWQQTRLNQAEYADLPIGRYAFEVKAVDRDLNYSATPAVVHIRISPPYERIAAYSSLGLALIIIIWQSGRVLRRDRRLAQQNRELGVQANQLAGAPETQPRRRIGRSRSSWPT